MTSKPQPLYLDYQATTPIDDDILSAMNDIYRGPYGNPHSSEHAFGWRADAIIENARKMICKSLNISHISELIFTSGATEANNIAILGMARAYKTHHNKTNKKPHILISPIEHKCVMMPALELKKEGFDVDILPIQPSGVLTIDDITPHIKDETFMLAVMHVNNEIGTVQPIQEIASLCAEKSILLHVDAAQGVGRAPINLYETPGIASLSVSGHKIYGPKGVGCLYIRRRPKVQISPLFYGGNQEGGVRPGTLATPLVHGLALGVKKAVDNMDKNNERVKNLRDLFLKNIQNAACDFRLNGDADRRIPHNLNLTFFDISADDFFARIKNIAVSSSSACQSANAHNFSHVLKAIGIKSEENAATIRLAFSHHTTPDDVARASDEIINILNPPTNTTPDDI